MQFQTNQLAQVAPQGGRELHQLFQSHVRETVRNQDHQHYITTAQRDAGCVPNANGQTGAACFHPQFTRGVSVPGVPTISHAAPNAGTPSWANMSNIFRQPQAMPVGLRNPMMNPPITVPGQAAVSVQSQPMQPRQHDPSLYANRRQGGLQVNHPASVQMQPRNFDLPKVTQMDTSLAAQTQAPPPRRTVQFNDESGNFQNYITIQDGKVIYKGKREDFEQFKEIVGAAKAAQVEFMDIDKLDSGRIIALDFDQTIVKVFLWKELNNGDESLLQNWVNDGRLLFIAFGGQQRVKDLRRVLQRLHDNGDLLCVLSGCTAGIIKKALKYVGLDDLLPEDKIFGSDTVPFGLDKSKRLDNLLEKYQRHKGALVDDDIGHCRRAVMAGHDALWVRHQAGMGAREMQRLMDSDWDDKKALGV